VSNLLAHLRAAQQPAHLLFDSLPSRGLDAQVRRGRVGVSVLRHAARGHSIRLRLRSLSRAHARVFPQICAKGEHMNERIVIKCKSSHGRLARVNAMPAAIVIDFGKQNTIDDQFYPVQSEQLHFDDFPELEGVYDHFSGAWNVDKLYALLHEWCEELDA
jgi:hypothetical protein